MGIDSDKKITELLLRQTYPTPKAATTAYSSRFDSALLALGLPKPWSGTVASLYNNAICLKNSPGEPSITLFSPEYPLLPLGIEIELSSLQLNRHVKVTYTNGQLSYEGIDGNLHRLVLNGKGTSLYMPMDCSPIRGDILMERLNCWVNSPLPQRTLLLLGIEPDGKGMAANLLCTLRKRLSNLCEALAASATLSPNYNHHIKGLSGLGTGSTPTGDDMLVAIACMARPMTGKGFISRHAFQLFCEDLTAVSPNGTTEVAREMLHNASNGHFPEPLLLLVRLLFDPDAPSSPLGGALTNATDALARLGGSSGQDMLAALVTLCKWVCDKERLTGQA